MNILLSLRMSFYRVFITICLVQFALTHLTYAHLGETKDELIKRFGSPAFSSDESTIIEGHTVVIGSHLMFKSQDWQITCVITEGRCSKTKYQKVGTWMPEHFEIALNSNAQGAQWTLVSKPSNEKLVREWRRSDGATAKWIVTGGMELENPAYQRFLAKKIAEVKGAMRTVPSL